MGAPHLVFPRSGIGKELLKSQKGNFLLSEKGAGLSKQTNFHPGPIFPGKESYFFFPQK